MAARSVPHMGAGPGAGAGRLRNGLGQMAGPARACCLDPSKAISNRTITGSFLRPIRERLLLRSDPFGSIPSSPGRRRAPSCRSGHAVRVVGYAWCGSQPIQRVEISLDGGANWNPAELTGPDEPYAWRLWQFDWQPGAPGAYVVASRAVDRLGVGQPDQVGWNLKGYANNTIRPVQVRIG